MSAVRRVGRTQYAMLVRLALAAPEALPVLDVITRLGEDVRPATAFRSLDSLVGNGYVAHVCDPDQCGSAPGVLLNGHCRARITEMGLDARCERRPREYRERRALTAAR